MKDVRRIPVQKRSIRYTDKILKATDNLLKTMEFDAVTTNHIAEEAGGSVGGIYRIFPNKYVIFIALLERYVNEVGEAIESFHDEESYPSEEWRDWLFAFVKAFISGYQKNKSFKVLWDGLVTTEYKETLDRIVTQVYLPKSLPIFQRIAPARSKKELKAATAAILLVIRTYANLDSKITQSQGISAAALSREIKAVIYHYVESLID